MAKKEIQIGINYTVNQQSLNNFKKSLEGIRNLKFSDMLKINPNLTGMKQAQQELLSIRKDASIVEDALEKAFNPKIGSINLSKFNQELKKENKSIKDIYHSFNKAGVEGQKAFTNLATTLMTVNAPLKQSHKVLNEIATTLSNTLKWNIASGAINKLTGSVKEAYGYVKALDSSLNSIQIVTQKSADTMAEFAVKANDAAKALGTGTKDYTDAALTFYQQGLSDQEVAARTETTLKVANVTGLNADVAAEYVTSVVNGYKVAANEVEKAMDKISAVGAATASSLSELSEGMSKVASTANAMGVSEDQLAATLSTVISVTRQDASTIGTAFKTIYARISDIEAGSEDAEVSLGEYTSKMASLGFSVLDSSGKLKDLGAVMEEIGGSWANLSREQQISLAQTMAGTRQYNNLIALFDNWDAYTKSLNVSMEANGTLQQQQDTYMESTAAHLQTLTTNLEDLYDSLLDTNTINSLSDIFSGLVSGVTTWVDALGGGSGVLLNLGSIAMTVFSQQIGKGIATTIKNFKSMRDEAALYKEQIKMMPEFKSLGDDSITRLAEMRQAYDRYANFMNEEQKQAMLNEIKEQGILEDKVKEWNAVKKAAQDYLNVLNRNPEKPTQVGPKGEKGYEVTSTQNKDISTLDDDQIQENISAMNTLIEASHDFQDAQQNISLSQKDVINQLKIFNSTSQEGANAQKINNNATKAASEDYKAMFSNLINLKQAFEILTVSIRGHEKELNLDSDAILNFETDLNSLIQQTENNPNINLINDDKFKNSLNNILNYFNKTVEDIQQKAGQTKTALLEVGTEVEQDALEHTQNFKNNLRESFKTEEIAQSVVKLTGSISQITMAIQNLKNIGNIWSNDDISTGEKMAQTFSSIVTVIPMVIMGINGIRTAIKTLEISSGILIVISVAIMAVVTAVTFIIDAFQAEEKQMKQNIKTANELSDAYNQLKDSYDGLKSSMEDYESALKAVNELEKGTYAWKEAIEAANEKAKELIESNEDLKQFAKTDPTTGLITFDEEKYKEYLDEQKIKVNQALINSNAAEIQTLEDQQNQKIKDFSNKNKLFTEDFGVFSSKQFYAKSEQEVKQFHGANAKAISTKSVGLSEEEIKGIIEVINEKDLNKATSDQKFQEAIDSAESLSEQQKAMAKLYQSSFMELKDSLDDSKNATKELAKEMANASLENNLEGYSDLTDFQKDLISDAATNLKKDEKQISDISKDEAETALKGKTDKEIVDQYAKIYGIKGTYREDWGGIKYIDENGEEKTVSKDSVRLAVGANLAVDDIVEENQKDLQEMQKQSEDVQDAAEEIGQKYGIENLGNIAQQFLAGKGDIKSVLTQISPEQADIFKKDFQKIFNGIDFTKYGEQFEQVTQDSIQTAIDNIDYNSDEWDKTVGTSAKKAIDNFTTVTEKVKSGEYTAENIGEKEDYNNLIAELKTIQKEYPELTNDVELLNKTWLVGAQEYEDALNRVQDAVAAVDIDKQNKMATKSIEKLKKDFGDTLDNLTEKTANKTKEIENSDGTISVVANIDDFSSKMDEILSAQYEIDVAIHAEAEDEFDKVSDVLSDIKDKASLIGEDFVVAADDIRDLNNTFPGILEGMTILSDGTIKLNKEMVESAMAGAEAEAQADSQALIDKLQNQATLLRAKQKTYETMAEAAAALAQGETKVEGQSADAKALISSGLSELEQYNSQATAETSKDANEEVSKSAAENGEAFAKNWQAAYDAVNTSAYDAANNQISYMNQVRNGILGAKQDITPVNYKGTEVVSEETDITRKTKEALESGTTLEKEWANISQTFETMAKSAGDQAADIESMIAQIGASAVGLDSTLSNVAKGKGATGETADQIDLLKDELDIYRAINNEIQDITRNLEDLTKQQEKLTGPALIRNLNKQLEILNKQADAYERKLKIAEQEASKYAAQLRGYGVTFDSSNQMANYDALYTQMEKSINAQINAYNSLSKSQQTDQKKQEIENSKNQLEKLKEIAGKYDTVINSTLPEIIDNLEDISEKEYEVKIEKLNVAIQEATDKTDWSKLYDEFLNREQYLSDNIIGKTLLTAQSNQTRNYLRNQMQAEYEGASAAVNAMNIIDKGGIDEIYGTDRAKALENAKTYGESLMSNIQDIYNTLESLNENVITGIDEVDSAYSDLNSTYENIGKTYQNGMKLLKLIYGEDNYAGLNNYYQKMQTNYEKQLMNLRNEKEYWLNLMKTVEENSDEWKKYQQNFISASDSLNSTLETAIQNIIDKYTNAINEIFKSLEDKVTNGLGLDYINDEWTLIKDNSEQYLDAINAAYNIQSTKSKYLEAINATDDVKAQKQLNKLMEEQIAKLETKDKLTEYDVERAEKVLTLEQKRIALEEAQQNKSKMRLRRNAAGDYTYQFVADEDNIAKARQELLDAENDLYNLDLNEYNESLDRAYELYSEYQEKVLQVYTDTSLSQEERDKKLYLLNSQYQEALAQASERNTTARVNLENSANETIKLYYEDNLEKFNNMIDEDGRLIMEELVPGWSSGVQNMITEIIKDGGLDNVMQKTLADANRAVQDLSEEEQKTAEIAGADLADIQSASLEEADILSGNVVNAQESVLNMAKNNLDTVIDIRDEYQNWANDILNTLVPSYDSLIRKINEAIARAQQLAAEASRNYSINTSGYIPPSTSGSGSGSGSGGSGSNTIPSPTPSPKPKEKSQLGTLYPNYTSYEQHTNGQKYAVGSKITWNGNAPIYPTSSATHATSISPRETLTIKGKINSRVGPLLEVVGYGNKTYYVNTHYGGKVTQYDTGGYTGAWGADGRIAMLHQKELVLNAKDTENMLNAVNILRAMTDNLGDSIFNRLANIPNGYSNILNQIPNTETLEQKVQIEAVFPNVSNSHEIENAFNNLVNIASQRALRNKK